MSSLLSALHCSAPLLTSSSCVVPVCTAIFNPHRSDVSILPGLPFLTTHVEPALNMLTKSTAFMRSGVMVNDETPISYFEPIDGMIELKFDVCGSASRPNVFANALTMSTSKPTGVLPSAARNSAGAYDVSMPTVSLPSLVTEDGSILAIFSSFFTPDTS